MHKGNLWKVRVKGNLWKVRVRVGTPIYRAGPSSSMYWQYYCTGNTTVLAVLLYWLRGLPGFQYF